MPIPAISIIMNCCNCAKDLPAALESVASQTFSDWEIVFWDNCSTDKSADIAKAFGSRLRYFKAAEFTSLGKARNLALQQATGKYFAFLDCDDLWRPEKLALQLALFEKNPHLGLVCTDTEIFDGKKTLGYLFKRAQPKSGLVFEDLMKSQWISMSSAMLSRKALETIANEGNWFDERLELCEEADVFYRIAHDWELDYVNLPLTVWRVHGQNSTFRNFDKFADETLYILDKQRAAYPGYDREHGEIAQLLKERANFQKAVALWRQGKGNQARKLLVPQLNKAKKYQLFWLASFLPKSMFNTVARIYFSMSTKS